MELTVGAIAPAFTLPDQNGMPHTLADNAGKWVLLYFYPKDETPGCIEEACTIRDAFGAFGTQNAEVLGVSTDSVESHRKFAEHHKLPFTILADPEKKVVTAYGVWKEKSIFGKTFLGTKRTSFLINPEGRIEKIYRNVKPPEHAAEVLKDLAAHHT